MDIYNLEVIEIRPTVPCSASTMTTSLPDGRREVEGHVHLIEECRKIGQPLLVGTTSIEKSEMLAEYLKRQGYTQRDFTDTNAFASLYAGDEGSATARSSRAERPLPQQEAFIVSQAGVPRHHIATNMAGRARTSSSAAMPTCASRSSSAACRRAGARRGGEAHPRAGRKLKQKALRRRLYSSAPSAMRAGASTTAAWPFGTPGDPGHSRFFLSLQDDLMRIFGSERMDGMLQKLG